MRIVAGSFRGRTLSAPAHEGLRPTSDRVRESVFNILAHGNASAKIENARVIDLFAGTGALGLEAMSRGAAYCLFVEENAEARALIRRNVEAFGLTGQTRIFRRDATDLGPIGTMEPYDIAFLDPPYRKELGTAALNALREGGWLRRGAMCVVEEHVNAPLDQPNGYLICDRRTWGDTQVIFLKAA